MSYNVYHWCLVPECNNTSIKTQQKLWIQVQSDNKMRKTWLKLARRDPKSLSTKTRLYFCEDHFDYCLSSDAAKPCWVLSWRGLHVMLDCGLSMHSLLNFLPLPPVPSPRLAALPVYSPPHLADPQLEGELRECMGRVLVSSAPEFCPPLDSVVPFAQLDAVLISNYTCMLALPFVTEGTGFRGQVLATEPTLAIARFYLDELAEWLSSGGSETGARRWKELLHVLPPPLAHAARPRHWRRLFSPEAIRRSLSRVRVVGYDEKVDLFGALSATPAASGFCLGSANWVLRGGEGGAKLAYVSGSSTLTTHPRPINQAALRGCDALLLAALTQTPAHNPDHALGDLCVHAALTLRAGGCVLLPVYPSGVLYDLLECLSAHLEAGGLGQIPMYVVGPVADASLAYSNILAEWVSASKAARVLAPDEPFPHAALARSGRLRHATALHAPALADFRAPCVAFAGHPSLRFGAAVHLLELWGQGAQNAVIFTEPDFAPADALAPFQPLQIKAFHCPIDTSLNYTQAAKLVKELRPRRLLLPDQYAAPNNPHRSVLVGAGAGGEAGTLVVRRGAGVSLALRRRHAPATLSSALVAALRHTPPTPAGTQLSVNIQMRDNRVTLDVPPPLPAAAEPAAPPPPHTASAPLVDRLLAELSRAGLGEARVERRGDGGDVLHLPRHDALLHLQPKATHVFCDARRARLRQAIRDAVHAAMQHAPSH